MHDDGVDRGGDDLPGEVEQRDFGVLIVDAEPAFDRDRNARADAVADELRLQHQTGADGAVLHAIEHSRR